MIRLEDVIEQACKRFAETHGIDPDAMPVDPLESIGRDFDRVAATFAALVDEINAELERVTGAILERVGARDLTAADAAKIAGTAPPGTSRELTGDGRDIMRCRPGECYCGLAGCPERRL